MNDKQFLRFELLTIIQWYDSFHCPRKLFIKEGFSAFGQSQSLLFSGVLGLKQDNK